MRYECVAPNRLDLTVVGLWCLAAARNSLLGTHCSAGLTYCIAHHTPCFEAGGEAVRALGALRTSSHNSARIARCVMLCFRSVCLSVRLSVCRRVCARCQSSIVVVNRRSQELFLEGPKNRGASRHRRCRGGKIWEWSVPSSPADYGSGAAP